VLQSSLEIIPAAVTAKLKTLCEVSHETLQVVWSLVPCDSGLGYLWDSAA
jgi:hypothetical protein